MPRKKLTKTQVKRELGKMQKAIGRLFIDKVDHTGSAVPMGVKSLLDLNAKIGTAFKRVK